MADYLIGIDNGGSEIKCALFDASGNSLGVARRRVRMEIPRPGWTERNPAEVWSANASAIREVIQNAEVAASEIRAVGLTGYGNGIVLTDRTGKPTYNCIVSTDSRASEYGGFFKKNGAERAIYPATRQTVWSAQPAALLPWFRDNHPEILEESAYCLGIKDWIRYCLTGEMVTEITEASSTCLCNLDTRQFDDDIFSALGIAQCRRLMPPIAESTAVTGIVTPKASVETGLAAGTPVAGGYFDIDAAALASGVLDDRQLCLVAGTWSINEYISATANADYDSNANTVTLSYLPGYYLTEDSSPTSASNFDWFVENLMRADRSGVSAREIYRECDALLEAMPPEEGRAVFVPYLFDSATTPGAKGAFFNLDCGCSRAHMMQAVYEGVVFSSLFHVRRLRRPRESFSSARLSGGVAHSRVWSQMMADVLQMPVEILGGSELSALGAAMGAGVACGLFPGLSDAADRMTRVADTIYPRAEFAAIYEMKYAAYERALEALAVFHRQ